MIADVSPDNAGRGRREHLAIEAPTGVGKLLSHLGIPGIIAREEQNTGGQYR